MEKTKNNNIREEALSKIDPKSKLLKKVTTSKQEVISIMDVEVIGGMPTQRNTISLTDRIANKRLVSEEDIEESEVEVDPATDFITLNKGKEIRVVETKALNSAVNKASIGAMYGQVSISFALENCVDSYLELYDPDVYVEPIAFENRSKINVEDGKSVRNTEIFNFHHSCIVKLDNGNLDFFDIDGFNHIRNCIAGFKSHERNVVNQKIINDTEIQGEDIYRASLAITNKNRIRKYIGNTIDQDLDISESRRLISEKVAEIWDSISIRSLTNKKLVVNFSINKIHIGNPNEFSSTNPNIKIMEADNSSMKVERLKYCESFSIPLLNDNEITDKIRTDAIQITEAFMQWGNNESRNLLDLEVTETDSIKGLKSLYNTKNKKMSEMLGISAERKSAIIQDINEKVEMAINMDKINSL